MSKAMVLGSSGYIGVNLVRNLPHEEVICVAGRHPGPADRYALDLSMSLLEDGHPLYDERPTEIYILARPVQQEYESNRIFYLNLQSLLLRWCAAEQLRLVHFLSTTNLYSIRNLDIKTIRSPVAPYGHYEYFKLETELFLDYLSRNFRDDVDFSVTRIPIAFGGIYNPARNQDQFLYSFINSYRHGWTWKFESPEDEQFGTSWVHTEDLALTMANSPYRGGGFKLRNASSGFFTYSWLHGLLEERFQTDSHDDLHLFRSRMHVEDDLDMPQRDLQELIDQFLQSLAND